VIAKMIRQDHGCLKRD